MFIVDHQFCTMPRVLTSLLLLTVISRTLGAAEDPVDPEVGLSGWTAWSCDVSCGTGIAFRVRSCIDFEKPCLGPKKQTRPGCSKFPCPSHDRLPKKLWHVTGKVLADMHYNFEVNTSDAVELRCNNDAARKFNRYYPRSTIHWMKNEQPLLIEPSRTVYDRGDLLIQMVTPSDTGLYQCKIEWEAKKLQSIGIYAVSVKSTKYQRHTKISKKLVLRCNNRPLTMLYGQLDTHWMHNGEMFQINATTHDPKKDFTLELAHVKKEHEGLWLCIIRDTQKGRSWVTNRLRLFVGPEPSAIEKFLSNPVYLWGTIITSLLFTAFIIALCSFYDKKERERKSAMEADPIFADPMKLFLGIPDNGDDESDDITDTKSDDVMTTQTDDIMDTKSDDVMITKSDVTSGNSFTDSMQAALRGIVSAADSLEFDGYVVRYSDDHLSDQIYQDEDGYIDVEGNDVLETESGDVSFTTEKQPLLANYQ